ncbi:hypothetical protein ABS764_13170 [Flavobacterium sp. ST-87]|uniref:Uncharacterized protein n=1 Tax=Flavobacterium plantiphilum TaxID=3163297 RepID=A0ABW8XX45_9FLAO
MENLQYYSSPELQKCPFHSQYSSPKNNEDKDDDTGKSEKPDETGTNPKRYTPDKFEKSPNERSGGDGSTESAAEELNNL